jgi:hypothetical protein
MIMFLNDWKRHPGAIPDTKTKNTSFLKLAEKYRRMGIKNCLFILALHNPALQGVDPFDPNLTLEMKVAIAEEAKANPWYYLREIARVPVQGSPEPSMYLANRANIAMMWCWLCGMDYANIMPRQCGKSVGADILNIWVIQIAGNNTVIQLFTHSNKLRNANIKRMKAIRDLLPDYLNWYQPGIDPDNQERLACAAISTEYLTSVAQKDADAAHNAGRGLTSPIIQVDEGPFCPNIHISLPVALGSTGAARDWAKERGTFYGNIFTTTAGKRDSKEGGYMYSLIHDGMYWREQLLDCPCKEAAEDMVKLNSVNDKILMINGTFSALQIGKSIEWLREKIAQARGSREDAERDYLNIWTSGTDTSPLPTELLEVVREARKEVVYTEVSKESYVMDWYIPEYEIPNRMQEGHYIITVDTANMIGKDANALHIIDVRNMEVVATSNINEGSLPRYADWLFRYLMQYPNTTLVMENKSSAQTMFDLFALKMIAMGINPFRRMFNYIVNDRARYDNVYKEMVQLERDGRLSESFYEKHKKKFGFQTTGATRYALYNEVFQRAARTCSHVISSAVLSDQILGLVMKNNRVDHQAGKNDDSVISWLMGHWFTTQGINLSFYGIEPGIVQSLVSEAGATSSPEELEARRKQNEIMERITYLKSQLENAPTELFVRTTELQIAKLARQLDDKDSDKIMEDLLNRARDTQPENQSLSKAVKKINRERDSVFGNKKVSGWY